MSKTMDKPSARRAGIVVKKLNNETLIYDTERHKAHCLNDNAALIWEHCDGNRSIKDLGGLLTYGQNVTEDQKDQIVWIALDQLETAHLLEQPVSKPVPIKHLSRRQMMKVAGIAALIAIPVVSTIVAPSSAEASTCLASGQGCTISAQCCSGLCGAGTCA